MENHARLGTEFGAVCGGGGSPHPLSYNMPQFRHLWCRDQLGGEEQRGLIFHRQVMEVSALKGGRHLLQEEESLRKVPKTKFVNKSGICVNLK